jgi:hypothetical protein
MFCYVLLPFIQNNKWLLREKNKFINLRFSQNGWSTTLLLQTRPARPVFELQQPFLHQIKAYSLLF